MDNDEIEKISQKGVDRNDFKLYIIDSNEGKGIEPPASA